jgi:hypothetical protein
MASEMKRAGMHPSYLSKYINVIELQAMLETLIGKHTAEIEPDGIV